MNELTTVRHGADVEAYRASTEAATICKEIVVNTSSNIQGKNYVAVEGWQAIAIAHGCALSAKDVERIDGGVRAVGEVRRMSDGQIIATAEGFVGEDEAVWFGGTQTNKWGKTTEHQKRPDYAIRAMAQTRAMSRAGRTAFAHVVVMMNAGLATTPAEEMVTFDASTGEVIEAQPERQKVPGISKIKERLNKFMREGDACTDLEEFRKMVKENRADLKAIRDAKHQYWTGDGEDHEGFEKWMDRRYTELEKPKQSLEYQLLVSTLQECSSMNELQAWLKKNGDVVETLDGEESRSFEEIYGTTETALKALDNATAGA